MAVGDVVSGLIGIFTGEAVTPVQIGQLAFPLEVDVVGLLVILFEFDIEIAAAGPEPASAYLLVR